MNKVSMLKCIECYEVRKQADIENLPIIYRQNRALKYLAKEFDLVISKGVLYCFNKVTGLIDIVFSAIVSYKPMPELTCELISEELKYSELVTKIKGD